MITYTSCRWNDWDKSLGNDCTVWHKINITVHCGFYLRTDLVHIVYFDKQCVPSEWRDIRPSMMTHTRNLCSAFDPSKVHTHSSEHTPKAVSSHFMLRRPGSSWGFGALLEGTSVVVLKVEREHCTFTPPTYNSCRPRLELATFRLRGWLSNH